jgi:hypothetical protein
VPVIEDGRLFDEGRGEPEPDDLQGAVIGPDQDVSRVDVHVNHAARMDGGDDPAQLLGDMQEASEVRLSWIARLVEREAAACRDPMGIGQACLG